MLKKKIVLIEDNEDIREPIANFLTEVGYIVNSYHNGQEALDALTQVDIELPALIVLDLMMPVMNGHEFREIQLGNAKLRSIPILVMSAGSEETINNSLFRGVHYIPKPLNLAVLAATIKNFLG